MSIAANRPTDSTRATLRTGTSGGAVTMSQIVTEVYDAFRAANIGEEIAKAAAGAIAGREDSVTKLDLERAIGNLRTEIGRVETDLKLVFLP